MLAKASVVSRAKHKWLRAIGRPVRFVVELRSIPYNLESVSSFSRPSKNIEAHLQHDLRDLYRVGARAISANT